jgi:hypothetical protein
VTTPRTPMWGDNSREARHRESASGIERGRQVITAECRENEPETARTAVQNRAGDAQWGAILRRSPASERRTRGGRAR